MAQEAYNPQELEPRWQKRWAEEGTYRSAEDATKEKAYVLDMFPYPSGEGLHVGHPKGYIATDVVSRHARMQGKTVLHPMGWDAFGLPAENFALKNKVHPRVAVEKNIARFKEQLQKIGFDYDWSREINTTDPSYYHWTQWIFLKLYEHGLAFRSEEPINWCPSCKTGLANEDVEQGRCERCDTPVEKKVLPQWVLKITDYADRLLHDLELLPKWPEHIKESQRNWIGRSEGAEIDFAVSGLEKPVTVFTTRADTLFGATYLVLAPEHPALAMLAPHLSNRAEVSAYVAQAAQASEIDRTAEGREKTGVRLEGVSSTNPATGAQIPVYVADYVLGSYGTGAIMAVPAHDERDFAFAQKFGLLIKRVVEGGELPYVDDGALVDSGDYSGKESAATRAEITARYGRAVVKYKLRDWVFSRQRYWGEPIPIIYCEKCGAVPVPYEDLPVRLPEVEHYEPTGTGESPLAAISDWVNTTCTKCKGAAKRETNTMPQWAGSSWYYLRYMDPQNEHELVSGKREKYWAPVDVYVGGAEHATRHLIYARFWHKFLYDIGILSTKEPFTELHSVGLIIAEDGRKMSKRFGNVVNPDDIVAEYGADALRVYEMFMGPFENAIAWNTQSLVGARRFLDRVWRLAGMVQEEDVPALASPLAKTIQKVGDDIRAFRFNTAISQMMIFLNAAEDAKAIGKGEWRAFLKILAPFAPHITEELWYASLEEGSVHTAAWPTFDPALLVEDEVEIAVQINGKTRGTITLARDASEEAALAAAKEIPAIAAGFAGRAPSRVIYVPGRILNIVVEK